jgi:hypothetical protein
MVRSWSDSGIARGDSARQIRGCVAGVADPGTARSSISAARWEIITLSQSLADGLGAKAVRVVHSPTEPKNVKKSSLRIV